MKWERLLSHKRLSAPDYQQNQDRPAFIQDADRITFSSAL